MKNKA
jgi:hypothetical protein